MKAFSIFKEVLELESRAISTSILNLNKIELDGIELLLKDTYAHKGTLIFIGVGKSGFIARKLASTFSSLGQRSFFIHPTEALHGDLGQISSHDTVVLISKSGSTEEILKLLPFLPVNFERRISLIGKIESSRTF